MILGFLFRLVENHARLGVLLPFAFCVLLGHERLFAYEEQI
jgi:hypothetical protein